jgi:hypothetical protein
MKKALVALVALMAAAALAGCVKETPDYSIAEAFARMNDAIVAWREADSFVLDYQGTYASPTYTNEETMSVKMKKTGTDDLVAAVSMTVTETDVTYQTINQYEDGRLYVVSNKDGSVTRTWKTEPRAEFESLYRSFLKKPFLDADTRDESIQVDPDVCTVTFELAAGAIEDTLFVNPALDRVTYATVSVTFNHDGTLLALDVAYGAFLDEVGGTETYAVTFAKLDHYVVIARLSASEKAAYTEAEEDAE